MSKRQNTIQETLVQLSAPNVKPSALLKAVKQAHPDASKKEILRAAFACVIDLSDQRPLTAKQLQDFAIENRGQGGD